MIIKWINNIDCNLIIYGLCLIIVNNCAKIKREPKVETGAVTDITINSAVATGNIIDQGDGLIDYGHCWSTTTNPTIIDFITSLGIISRTGSYTSILQSLQPGTKYYIKAYVENANGEVYYGGESSFSTYAISLPTIITTPVTSITSTTAISGGDVISDGGATVIARGVCWSTSDNPTIALSTKTSDGTGTGTFTSVITDLTSNTTYHVRAYATNSIGTAYGDDLTFTSDPLTISDNDGNTYNVIRIGTQLWMKENLKTTKYNDGTNIPLVTDNAEWSNLTAPAYCWYNNDENAYKNVYGAIYNWYTVNTGKLCPIGWQVPSDEDWTIMENYLILNGYNYDGTTSGNKIAKSLASVINWHSSDSIGAVGNTDYPSYRNKTGFTALPCPDRGGNGAFAPYVDLGAAWWSITDCPDLWAIGRVLWYSDSYMSRNCYYETLGFYVRCIKD